MGPALSRPSLQLSLNRQFTLESLSPKAVEENRELVDFDDSFELRPCNITEPEDDRWAFSKLGHKLANTFGLLLCFQRPGGDSGHSVTLQRR